MPCRSLKAFIDQVATVLAATVPADKIEGFHSFVLTALAHYTAPSIKLGVAM
jgi:hypothetical protein